jgi:hypothetical protein
MKKYFLYLGIVVAFLCNYHITQSLDCCSYIGVTPEITDSCCVKIHVDNPQCSGAVITLEIKNGATWTEVYKDSITQSPIITYCPPNGSGLVEYRVKITEPFKPGEPYCGGAGPYIEGYTMYSGSVYLECCEDCPEGYENWFNLESKKSNDCPDNGCEVTHSLNIPDSINCYVSYKVETDSSSTAVLPLAGDSLSDIDRCISAGTTYNAKVILFTANGDSCIIEKSVFCDLPRDTNDLQEPCTPDCFDTPFGQPLTHRFDILGCSGPCQIKVTYVTRKACNHWQDLQILRMEISEGCTGCSESYLYRMAIMGIIDINTMNFEPDSVGCSTIWRVTQGGCWSEWVYYFIDLGAGTIDTVNVLEPCLQTECCYQPMKVCKTLGPPKTITITLDTNYVPPSINCDGVWLENPLTGWIMECEPKCDWLHALEGTYEPPALSLYGKEVIENDIRTKSSIGIKLIQLNDFLQVQLKNNGINSVKIRILDISGKEKVTISQNINDGQNIVRIPVDDLSSGAYILTIIADDYLVKTEKFIIK